jgi:Flp pilus assembly pilin Flp
MLFVHRTTLSFTVRLAASMPVPEERIVSNACIAIEHIARSEDAATIPEYALLLALITVICIGAISLLGTTISSFMTEASTSI